MFAFCRSASVESVYYVSLILQMPYPIVDERLTEVKHFSGIKAKKTKNFRGTEKSPRLNQWYLYSICHGWQLICVLGNAPSHPSFPLIPLLSSLETFSEWDAVVDDGKTAQRASHYLAPPPCVTFPQRCQPPRLPHSSNKLLNSVPHPCGEPTWTWPPCRSLWGCFIRFTAEENLI